MSAEPPDEPPVGPGNPPKRYRWKKGDPSPNPAGRPPTKKKAHMMKKPEGFDEMVLKLGAKTTRGLTGEDVTLIEAVYRRLIELAIDKEKPSLKALLMVLKTHREVDEAADKLRSDAAAAAFGYKDNMTMRLEHARKTGSYIDEPIPHPDDIIVTRERELIFVGPMTPEEHVQMKQRLAHRDLMLEHAMKLTPGEPHRDKLIRKLCRVWNGLNELLPPRLRTKWTGPVVPRRPSGRSTAEA